MKKLLVPLVALTLAGGIAFADHHVEKNSNQKDQKHVQKHQQTTTVKLYKDADTNSQVISTINVQQRLVPFFQKQGWVKVGDPKNGQVGWINKDQYQKAMNDLVHRNVKTIFIEQTANNGKNPQITVYQNGQKLTGSEANKIFQQTQKEQVKLQKQFLRMQKQLNRMFNQPMPSFGGPMLGFPTTPVLQPIVIVENQPAPTSSKQPAEPKK